MKHLILIISLLSVSFVNSFAQNNVMYVYRNDGVINAFLKTEIDHICYSKLDLDSIRHHENVVQEIWALDSVYRIPIEKIDSVSFYTPKTIYQPGTIKITPEMREYILASDSLMLTFSSDIPESLLPKLGDKLVNTEASGGLLSGFIGQVKEIINHGDSISIYCNAIGLTDVFECYYGFCSGNLNSNVAAKGRLSKEHKTIIPLEWRPGKFQCNLLSMFPNSISYEPDGNLLIPSLEDAELTCSLTPSITGTAFLIVNRDYGINFGIRIYGDYTFEEYMALTGGLTVGGDNKILNKPFPIPEVLCDIEIELGFFLRAGIKLCSNQSFTQQYKSSFNYEWSSKGHKTTNNSFKIENTSNSYSGIIALNGPFETGLYLKLGLAFIMTSQLDIAEVGGRLEGGLRIVGNTLPYVTNKEDALKSTSLYNMIKGKGFEVSTYYGTSTYAKFFSWAISRPNFLNIPFGKKNIIRSCYYVPDFSNIRLKDEGNYLASMDIEGSCYKTDIGFSFQSKNNPDDRINTYVVYDYQGPSNSAFATFYDKPDKEPYIIYPLLKIGELEMIASPSYEASYRSCPDSNHPHAIDLALPSGTKWCCKNEKAWSPEDYGNPFAWGELGMQDGNNYIYHESHYKYYKNGSYEYIGDEIAGTSYDAAYKGGWIMPNVAQFQELIDNCTITPSKQNGVNGILVKGKNGGCIFLPAAGVWVDAIHFYGNYGAYWCGSLCPLNEEYAFAFRFTTEGKIYLDANPRYYGHYLRAVRIPQ